MKLSLQDRVALIYTSAGSQREVARRLGISHQKVGRILKAGHVDLGGYARDSKALADPQLTRAVDRALADHIRQARAIAKRDGLPFDERVPVQVQRLERKVWREVVDRVTGEIRKVPVIDLKTGQQRTVPGERVVAKHTHWISNELRRAWVASTHRSGRYYSLSVRSIVDRKTYNKQAEQRARADGGKRSVKASAYKKQILADKLDPFPIYTAYTGIDKGGFPLEVIQQDLQNKLNSKHAPATGLPGTRFADEFLLQIDTRQHVDKAKPAEKGRRPAGTKRRR